MDTLNHLHEIPDPVFYPVNALQPTRLDPWYMQNGRSALQSVLTQNQIRY